MCVFSYVRDDNTCTWADSENYNYFTQTQFVPKQILPKKVCKLPYYLQENWKIYLKIVKIYNNKKNALNSPKKLEIATMHSFQKEEKNARHF